MTQDRNGALHDRRGRFSQKRHGAPAICLPPPIPARPTEATSSASMAADRLRYERQLAAYRERSRCGPAAGGAGSPPLPGEPVEGYWSRQRREAQMRFERAASLADLAVEQFRDRPFHTMRRGAAALGKLAVTGVRKGIKGAAVTGVLIGATAFGPVGWAAIGLYGFNRAARSAENHQRRSAMRAEQRREELRRHHAWLDQVHAQAVGRAGGVGRRPEPVPLATRAPWPSGSGA